MAVDSDSVGDPASFLSFDVLRDRFAALPAAPRDRGHVGLIVRRRERGRRELPDRLRFTPADGVPGDKWGTQATPDPAAQIAVMQLDVATLIAGGQSLELFGDQLFLELDLSEQNIPPGSRLRLGAATVEVTPRPHNGCKKFRARFGLDALQFVSAPETRHRNLRGIYLRVVEPGDMAVGDAIEVLSRAVPG